MCLKTDYRLPSIIQLKKFADSQCEKYPSKTKQIKELLELCFDEIESGEPISHEIELCMTNIKELTGENIH